MEYRKNIKNGDMLSALGFGAMRLPKKKDKKNIDHDESIRVLRLAYEEGINYFDTAYIYDDGESEKILGEAIKPFRNKIKLATKLPLRGIKSYDDFDKYFYTSLKRLDTDYVDYYLIHNIISFNQFQYIFSLGLDEWIRNKKESGEIINIGFSSHASCEDFIKIIDSYNWEFCQQQYNYMDENFQAGTAGLRHANKKGLPVIIMEPLRGGALVNKLPEKAEKLFKSYITDRSNADWALRWVLNHNEVTVVLSGMGSEKMLMENIKTANTAMAGSMTQNELKIYDEVRAEINSRRFIFCTSCNYCMPCPQGVKISSCFSSYNSRKLTNPFQSVMNYVSSVGGLTDEPGFASMCVGCGACEKKCPQNIKIREELKKVKKSCEFPLMKPIIKVVKKVIKL